MFVYWFMFAIPIFAISYPLRMTAYARNWAWRAIYVLFVLIIGLRFEVGGDWNTYWEHYESVIGVPLKEAIYAAQDPAYVLIVWLCIQAGLGQSAGIYAVNLVCGAVVMVGINYFCRRQPQPWIALAVAVPYMIIVVVMGYSRQGVALGLELVALVALTDGRLLRFLFLIACAGLFHKSAVLLLPLGVLASTEKKLWVVASMIVMAVLLGSALLLEYYDALWTNYVQAQMESEGGPIRVAMNAVPAIVFLLFAKKFAPMRRERKIWVGIALFSLICIPLVGIASTAVDRVALYFMPIQLYVYSRIECLFRSYNLRWMAIAIILAGYALVLWVLLKYATFVSVYWVPYNNAVFF